jgi:hypothetical protein
MELADDAEGRVTIFAVDVTSEPATGAAVAPEGPGRLHAAGTALASTLDSRYAAPVLAGVLAVLLVLGLLLLRR